MRESARELKTTNKKPIVALFIIHVDSCAIFIFNISLIVLDNTRLVFVEYLLFIY